MWFDHYKACRRHVEVWRVGFDRYKVCMRPVEIRESVLTTAKHLGVVYSFGESI